MILEWNQTVIDVTTCLTDFCFYFVFSGIGVLSKHVIEKYEIKHVPYHSGPDKNKRVFIHVQITIGSTQVNIIAVHFSYDKTQQCSNALAVLKHISSMFIQYLFSFSVIS